MPISIDDSMALHTRALDVSARRASVLAANLANVDTPGYRARDIDFRSAMDEARAGLRMETTHNGHIRSNAGNGGDELMYRIPLQPSADGNTVNAHVEKAEFSKNAIRYSAALGFLGSRVNSLLNAVRGVE